MIQLTSHFKLLLIMLSLALLTTPLSVTSHEKESTEKIFNVEIKQQKVVSELKILRISQEDNVYIVWQSDEAAKLHLHGYDIEFDVSANEAKTLNFIATATGRFAVTNHGFSNKNGHGHEALLYIEVYPN